MKKVFLVLSATLLLTSCVDNNETTNGDEQQAVDTLTEVLEESIEYELKRVKEDSCFCRADTIQHAFNLGSEAEAWSRTVALPAIGKFTEEAHYVTSNDKFPEGRLFANTIDENIEKHLEVSLGIYRDFDPDATDLALYGNYWQREWTPAEGGAIGQGAIGEAQVTKLNPAMELWLMNMMWANGERPEIGTKFLLQANGKAVIVVAGFETGPASEDFLGGVTPEVHHWLGTDKYADIKVSYLKNQHFPYGPVTCLKKDTLLQH